MQQRSGSEHADDSAASRDAGPNADSSGAFVWAVGRRQQRERRRHDERRTSAGHAASRDEFHRAGENDRRHRGDCEERQAEQESASAAVAVTDGASGQQQARQNHRVAVDYPGQLRLGRRCGHGDVSQRRVQCNHRGDHHRDPHAGHDHRPYPCAVGNGRGRRLSTLGRPEQVVDDGHTSPFGDE